MTSAPRLEIRPLTPERWRDLEALFGPGGACGGCWCMWWRLPRAAWLEAKGEGNRRALRARVAGGDVPGLLAYDAETPVGWVALEPRAAYPRLAASRILAPVDAEPVWSITCFYVARSHRRRGVTRALIDGAVRHAREAGARILEAYPVDPAGPSASSFLYTGLASTFRAAGFEEIVRRSPTRPVVRKLLTAPRAPAARGRGGARSTRRSSPTRPSASRRDR